ncbi:MAG: single-stranded-DNA-specific exonuclease RecJ [Proteobacteria bacterium]|nr:single-stranded-DNA-specific exonuclease RecJ [Pseudomonadota bacterium]
MTINQFGKSVLGINWQQKQYDERLALAIAQKMGLSQNLAKLLATKSVALEEVENFLNPTIKASLPDPFALLDMDVAVNKIIQAIKEKKKIVIFGDYDVDGATSSALLKRFFRMVGVEVEIYIPDRISEGYGPNSQALLALKKNGADLVITVDCGAVAFEPLEAASNAGLDVIVVDHHLGALEKPKAIAIVNPNRLDEKFEHKNLAAVGVCFLLCVALNKLLKEENYYQQKQLQQPNLLSLLDLVALGTVCDVVPLTGVNRSFVSQGLKVMKNRQNLGIRQLCDLANLDEKPGAYHLGFVLGPRINAGGRVGEAALGATLLSSEDAQQTEEIAKKLDLYNKQRKDIEKSVQEEAIAQIEKSKAMLESPVLFAASQDWHPGVIGIVASRIKERYEKPVAVISLKDGLGKASCRSVTGVDFGSAIVQARVEGLVIEGGGHAMAGGFSIDEKKIDDLHKFFCNRLGNLVEVYNLNKARHFNDVLDINSANLNLAQDVCLLEPYGSANAKPRFMIKDLLIASADAIGADGKHVRCVFSSKTMAGWEGRISGIAFGAMESDLGNILISKNKSQKVNVIGQVNINSWMGNDNVQILIEDILRL